MVLSAIANYEDIGLKSLLIATIIGWGGYKIPIHLKRNGFKEKDDRIRGNF
jgi:hypothetical protein